MYAAFGSWKMETTDRRHALAALLIVAATAASYLTTVAPAVLRNARPDGGSPLIVWGQSILLDPQLTAPTLIPLALLGAGWLLASGRWRLLGAVAFNVALLALPGQSVQADRTDLIRYQTPSHLLLFLLPAALVTFPVVRFRGRVAAWTPAAVAALLLLLGSLPGLMALRVRDLDAAAFELIGREASKLPHRLNVFVPRPVIETRMRSDFPEYLLEARGHDVTVRAVWTAPPRGEDCFVYVSPQCYRFFPEELPLPAAQPRFGGDPVRRECLPLVDGLRPEPIPPTARRLGVPWRGQEFMVVLAEKPRVGLYPCAR
jgi:hypothetical protein